MKTIIVATDFSEPALRAARYAAALTHQIPVEKIILFHSFHLPAGVETASSQYELLLNLKEVSLNQLKTIQAELRLLVATGVIFECIAVPAFLQPALKSLVQEKKADMIIMGITGKNKMKEKVMGSQAILTAKNTSIPLMLIPFKAQYKKIEKVVLAWDMEETEKTFPAVLFKDILHEIKAGLLVLNVDYHNKKFNKETIQEQVFMHGLLDAEKASYFYDNHPDASNGILRFAEKQGAELVIIIPKKHSFPANLLKKRTTRKLAFHSSVPLLVLPGTKTD